MDKINISTQSLWDDDFEEPESTIKKVLKKISKPKESVTPEQALKSKKTSIANKLVIIKENVLRILGTYVNDTVVIKTKDQLHKYIDVAIRNKVLAVDTETNNSLDPITCKIMGVCIYTPEQKNAYIPINHVDLEAGERLSWQLTEDDLKEEFERLSDVSLIFHNGKFDYQVIKCTCNIALKIHWDTMIAARILDENERASLKEQYIHKIDPTIEKYDIENLFKGIEYAVVDPELFALYAATDAFMTYRLYEWQVKKFNLPENRSLETVFWKIEMPIVTITAEMELTGVYIDTEYAQTLADYYHKNYEKLNEELYAELENYRPKIEEWRKTPEANAKIRKEITEAEYMALDLDDEEVREQYEASQGHYYKLTKSKSEQLDDIVNLTSPTQLAILFYDVLGVREGIAQKQKKGEHKSLRGTGEEIIKAIKDEYQIPLCDYILKNREYLKLINTYIDKIPKCVNEKDGRVHTHFNQIGADTGRFSSSDPINLQNIPSHNHVIRALFRSKPGYVLIGSDYS